MDKHSKTNHQQTDEELVAYLDGELDPQQIHRVEDKLAEDPEYQGQLKGLKNVWEMLDWLPRANVVDSFAQTTVEMVAVHADKDGKQRRSSTWIRQQLFHGAAVATLFGLGLIGFLVMNRILSAPNRQLVRDLPVLENLDLYYHVDSIEFLHELQESGLFGDEVEEVANEQ